MIIHDEKVLFPLLTSGAGFDKVDILYSKGIEGESRQKTAAREKPSSAASGFKR